MLTKRRNHENIFYMQYGGYGLTALSPVTAGTTGAVGVPMYTTGSVIEFGAGIAEDLLVADYSNGLERVAKKALTDGTKKLLLSKIPGNKLTKSFIGQNASMASKYINGKYQLIYYGSGTFVILPK